MQRFNAEIARQARHMQVVTRGGYEVKGWHVRHEPNSELIPIEATLIVDGEEQTMTFTANGRRYINVISEYDLLLLDPAEVHDRDCMPDVMGAIQCVREHRYEDIKRCNKNNMVRHIEDGVAVDTSAFKNL